MQSVVLKRIPLFRVVVALIPGVWLHERFSGVAVTALLGIFFLLWIFVSQYFLKKPSYRYRYLPGLFFMFFVFVFGAIYGNLREVKVIDSNSSAFLKGYVVTDLGETSKSNKYQIVSDFLISGTDTVRDKLSGILYLKKGSSKKELHPGDVILLKARLFPFDKPKNPYAFDYAEYLKHERISFRAWSSGEDIKVIQEEGFFSLKIFVSKLHGRLSDTYQKAGITGDELGLLKAVFMGDRSGLMPENKRYFSDAGVMHLLAVSGLHLGIIYMLLLFLLKPLKSDKMRKVKFLVVLAVIWSYALFTGFSSSVFRAAVMFSMVEAGNLIRRSASVYNQLFASMIIIVLIEPYSVYKAGFWLSHAAVAGIVGFYPFVNNLLSFRFVLFRWAWSLISVSLAAQLATFPLVIYYFHKFPVYFIFSNVLLIPVLTPVLLLAFGVSLVTLFPVSITLVRILAGPLNELLGYMMGIVKFIGELSGANVRYVSFNGFELALFGLLFFSLVLYLNEVRKTAIFTFLVSLIFMVSSFTVDRIKKLRYSDFVVFYQNRIGVFNYLDNKMNKLLLTDTLSPVQTDYVCGGYWARHSAKEPNVRVLGKNNPGVFLFQVRNKKILLMHNVWQTGVNGIKPKVDYIVLSGRRYPDMDRLRNSIEFEKIILSTGLYRRSAGMLRKKAEEQGISCVDVFDYGAWLFSEDNKLPVE